MFCKKKIDIINILEAKVKNRVNNSCCEVMTSAGWWKKNNCFDNVVSFPPISNRTPEQEKRYRQSLKTKKLEDETQRQRMMRLYPALVQQDIITPLNIKYEERKQENEQRCAELKVKTQELLEMRKRRRQVLVEQQECVKRARSDVGQKPAEEANRISGASTEEQQQAVARAAASLLDFDPKEELSSSS